MRLIKQYSFFISFALPALTVSGFYYGGYGNLLTPCFVFIVVPVLDLLVGRDSENPEDSRFQEIQSSEYYKYLTYGWVFVQSVFLLWALYSFAFSALTVLESVLFILSVSLVTGGIGITVAHELGHKNSEWEQFSSKLLLLQVCYMHFYIEHNRGHHVKVSTPDDPASSRKNESFYSFYPRTVIGSYLSAWSLEKEKLMRKGLSFFHYKNEMIQFSLIQLMFVSFIFFGFNFLERGMLPTNIADYSWKSVLFFLIQSVLGFSLLEVVNYIEHYGLERKQLENGNYEKVLPVNSWNGNYLVSNALLFQLQRHSDHHANAARRYQTLRHFPEAPQLPYGYEIMILIALVPPLWFRMVNPILERWK
ncbi:alkane monooxygenase [Leptospira kobayashii]|uniref:Alkane monooxygenase n=1 Tax=Leptospira kobayashii TaxID=1917830 RepID=A0ABN6KC19_9LEPT|nr:alkane 1-monooxygenase [Leptospira kobayashii]BDA78296.1 alkane monooxygenase [Leptospira kobayashii]